jgi:hypothetical protein
VTESMKRSEGQERTSEISAISLSPSFDSRRHPVVTPTEGDHLTRLALTSRCDAEYAEIFLSAVRC